MPEIALTANACAYSPRLEYRSAAHAPRRRAQSDRCRQICRRSSSIGNALCGARGVDHRARPRRLSRRRGGESASGRCRGDHAGEPAGAGAGSGREIAILSCSGSICLQNDRVRYAGQPIAVVVAETLEAATEGAALLAPRYEIEPARVGLDATESFVPPAVGPGFPAEVHRGDVEAELAAATKTITATYETAAQYHNPMEPHAIVAAWEGDTLSIDTPSQGLAMAQARLAGTVRHSAGQNSHSQSVPRRRLRLQRPDVRTAGSRRHRRPRRGPAGQARAAARADVRSGGPSRADAADLASRHRRRRRADRARSSHQDGVEHVRRFLRAGLQCLAHALCEHRHRHLA